MVILAERAPYALADEGHYFHFIDGKLYPILGDFTEATTQVPVWFAYLGV